MKSEQINQIKVYYDGLCIVCSREIDHYRAQLGAGRIEFVDICSPEFDPIKEGLDPHQVHREMHVRRSDGIITTRVEAFITIWETLPKFNWLARLARQPGIRTFLELSYTGFTKIRPWLPRRDASSACQNSPYCEVKNVKIAR